MAKILIVDDEPRIAMFLEKGLRKQNHEAALAFGGRQALSMVLSQHFDLMLLDLGLPEIDGFDVLKGLRVANNTLPVVVITARGDTDCIRAIEFGADDCLQKPFRFSELLLKVRRLLGEAVEPQAC
ncbi:MAG: response regulator transcription factor [Cyanobacteria bacterium P01_H01_bin.105]